MTNPYTPEGWARRAKAVEDKLAFGVGCCPEHPIGALPVCDDLSWSVDSVLAAHGLTAEHLPAPVESSSLEQARQMEVPA